MSKKLTAVQKKIETLNGKLAKLEEDRLAAREELKNSLDERQAERVRMIEAEMSDIHEILTAAEEREQELIQEEQEALRQADFRKMSEMEAQASNMIEDIMKDIQSMFDKFESLQDMAKEADGLAGKYGSHGFGGKGEYRAYFQLYEDIKAWKSRQDYYYRHVKMGLSR